MAPPLLYVSVKVKPSVDTLAERIAGEIDSRRRTGVALERLISEARGWSAVVSARRRLGDTDPEVFSVAGNYESASGITDGFGDEPMLSRNDRAFEGAVVVVLAVGHDPDVPLTA